MAMQTWNDVEPFLLDGAAEDLAVGPAIQPCFVAFRGDVALFFAILRDFAKGEYQEPMIELLALAGGLGADRLAVSFGGRAWSWHDPIPPVLPDGGDLRQRVLVLTFVDAAAAAVRRTSTVVPYDVHDGRVIWGEPLRHEAGEGWITEAMTVAVQRRDELTAATADVRAQALRCQELGHSLGLSPATMNELRLPAQQPGRR